MWQREVSSDRCRPADVEEKRGGMEKGGAQKGGEERGDMRKCICIGKNCGGAREVLD